jgi:transposase
MRYVGGDLQARFMAGIRGLDREQCLVVPVDVGKSSALALVADHYGEVVVAPFEFGLTESGLGFLLTSVARAEAARVASVVRVGVEAAGHYHRTLVARLRAEGLDVVELNPGAVKEARSQQLLRGLKSDVRDLGAMAELLVRGAGRSPQSLNSAVAAQVAWAGHRRRKVKARTALGNQVLGQLDLVFPGLGACFDGILGAKAGRVILREVVDPVRIRRLGVEGLRRYVGRRGVRLSRPKAAQIVSAAREVLRLPEQQLAALRPVLAADVALLDGLDAEILRAEEELTLVLPATPAAVLVTLPGVAVVRASNYGAEIGDPWRFRNADAAYRFSGLVPTSYESAGKARPGQRISREGSVELREAILELGRGLAQHDSDFGAYRARLLAQNKKKSVVAVAVGHRAHRLAFAMLRSQQPYDPGRWARSVATGRSAMAKTPKEAHQNDVTCPPPPATMAHGGIRNKIPVIA